jgi:activator of HSP90 ATPase
LLDKLKTGVIRHKVLIPNATPDQVYKAFISSKEHGDFTGSPAKVSGRVGGKFTAWDGYISGKNIARIKGKKIEQEWITSEFPEGYGPSILRISLKKKGDGTELTMFQSKVPTSQVEKYYHGCYESYWDPLKEYFQSRAK